MRLLAGAWRILVGIKDALVLVLLLLFFGLLYAALTASPNPAVPGSGALYLDLSGVIVEQPEEPDPFAVLTGAADNLREYRLRDVVRALDAAATDDRITAVALDLDGFLGGGQSAVLEVGDAIQRVRDAGKPVIAYATGYADDGYALAAHASEIWVNPMGGALILGPGGTRLYYGELLDEIGVTANVFRVGAYKAAVEPFTRSDQSPESREANQALADTLFEIWREDVSRARPAARLDAIISASADAVAAANGDLARAALAARMVDHIGGRADWAERVAQIAGEDDSDRSPGFRAIPLANWIAAHPERDGGAAKIGVITVAGTIVDGEAGPGTAGGDTIARLIHRAVRDNDFAALVLRVDSPGGSALASDRIRRAVLDAAEEEGDIPVVVSMGTLAASGGYWVATAGDRIVAEPSTITGSIGVFSIIPTFEGTLEQLHIGADGVETTPLSGEPDLAEGLSPEAQRLLQAATEDIYRRFTVLVARSRDISVARADAIGQGRVWAGATARQLGLVDRFGTLDVAIAEAAELAGVDADDVQTVHIEKEPSAFAQFVRDWTRPQPAEKETRAVDIWSRLAPDPREVWAQAAGEIELLLNGSSMQLRCLDCPVEVRPRRAAEAGGLRALLLGWLRG